MPWTNTEVVLESIAEDEWQNVENWVKWDNLDKSYLSQGLIDSQLLYASNLNTSFEIWNK
eukprot:c34124_g1_i1 orf=42-221(+)